MGMFDGFNLMDAMKKSSTVMPYDLTGKGTPWAAPGEKGMEGMLGTPTALTSALGQGPDYLTGKPILDMQNQDLEGWAGMASGTSKKDQAPASPEAIAFDPNAYQANDYTSLQKAMQRNAGQTAYQNKRAAKAGVNPNSADYAASQAAIGNDYAAQQGDIANQIGGFQAQDKVNAYQDAVDAQSKEYQKKLQDWQYDVNKEGSERTGAIGRLGAVGGAVASYWNPALGAAVGALGQGAAQKYGQGYADASKKGTDAWYNYNKANTANATAAKNYSRNYSQQAGGY